MDNTPSPPPELMFLHCPALVECPILQLMEAPQLPLRATEQPSRTLILLPMKEPRCPHRRGARHTRASRRMELLLRISLTPLCRFPCRLVHQLAPPLQQVMLTWTTPTICSRKCLQAKGDCRLRLGSVLA
ncbi:hypothetical protein GQ55_5G487100 [Panicum hallii var. hallii]|uniref:Uncharacterized protein n=1 Tax=Panicum hallii var. hallii TaxID=1504633 RepID=A0A2T7DRF7_9POAL|nr:hypothetical protein GQ55_5G487100 [Panicum hallii var. hallii]